MEYCTPCDRYFGSFKSLEQHLESKHSRTYCLRCQKHFPHAGAKQQHIATSRQHHVCHNCHHRPDFDDEDELDEHLEIEHNICVHCGRVFESSEQLSQHDVAVHNKYISCGTHFESPSNLEAACESGADADYVAEVAFECYQSDWYTSNNPEFAFECPTCDALFSFMSGLLQHAESDACDQHLGRNRALGKFLHYLRLRLKEL